MLLICDECTAAYSVGAPRCPECGGTECHEQGTIVLVGETGPELFVDDGEVVADGGGDGA